MIGSPVPLEKIVALGQPYGDNIQTDLFWHSAHQESLCSRTNCLCSRNRKFDIPVVSGCARLMGSLCTYQLKFLLPSIEKRGKHDLI